MMGNTKSCSHPSNKKYIKGCKIIDVVLPFGALAKYNFDGEKYTKFA
jgi:hypothetical protein